MLRKKVNLDKNLKNDEPKWGHCRGNTKFQFRTTAFLKQNKEEIPVRHQVSKTTLSAWQKQIYMESENCEPCEISSLVTDYVYQLPYIF